MIDQNILDKIHIRKNGIILDSSLVTEFKTFNNITILYLL